MRVETGNKQAIAALSPSDAARSPAPSLRTGQKTVDGAQRSENAPRETRGTQGQQPKTANAQPVLDETRPRQPQGARLRVDKATHRIVTQLLDENDKIIKQVPPQELLDIAARFRQLRGLLFDKRA
jgi:uncharacterized FlaG/YvyC family protein